MTITKKDLEDAAKADEPVAQERIAGLEAEVDRLREHQLRTEQSASAIMDSQQKRIAELGAALQEAKKELVRIKDTCFRGGTGLVNKNTLTTIDKVLK